MPNDVPLAKATIAKTNFSKSFVRNPKHKKNVGQFRSIEMIEGKHKASIKKCKFYNRNYSSYFNTKKSDEQICEEGVSLTAQGKQYKRRKREDFQIRRPLARKDYFVFGLSDRMSA